MNGQDYKLLLEAGYALLKKNAEEINDLNVFPIPDGDTGDNMCSTMRGGVEAIADMNDKSLKVVSEKAARGMLLNARGNSGVILSQIFAGINYGFSELDEADLPEVINALEEGVKSSYKSVEKPTEGTILTVFREAVSYAKKYASNADGVTFTEKLYEGAVSSLERTPDLLDVLKEAGVVDSGGKGVCYIIKGMNAFYRGESVEDDDFGDEAIPSNPSNKLDFSLFTEDSVMKFGYCTEFLLRLTKAKTDISAFDIDKFIDGLKPLGDSIVAFLTGTVVKVHIHSFNPDRILNYALRFGEFLTMKMENMTLQHNETLIVKPKYKKNVNRKKYGVVTVATGKGLTQVFKDQGADIVINGGQGNNPSTEDFIEAYDAVNAEEIFVLPNNGNILLVANASANEYKKSIVHVVPSKSIGDGYSAMEMLDLTLPEGGDVVESMVSNMAQSVTGLVCHATRDANINSVEIKKDDFVGFSNKEMLCDDPDRLNAAYALLDKLGIKGKYFLVAFYGNDVEAAEREAFEAYVAKNYPDVEFYGMEGGQEVFDYVFVLE